MISFKNLELSWWRKNSSSPIKDNSNNVFLTFNPVNQSVTQSFASESSGNTSQNSMISEVTSLNESNAFGEDKIV